MNINNNRVNELAQKYPHLNPISKEANGHLELGYLVMIDLDAVGEIAKGEGITSMQVVDSLMKK